MISVQNAGGYRAGRPLPADELVEFHAARILLLLHLCGQRGKIKGLTKLAKLDFFSRYPGFLARAAVELGHDPGDLPAGVEAPMVRHHYGPWDRRYYHVLAYLESRGLLRVSQHGTRAFHFELTSEGDRIAGVLEHDPSFADLTRVMQTVAEVLGRETGNALKNRIYRLFEQEVADRPLGEMIAP